MMKTAAGLFALFAATEGATCGEALQECENLCADRGFVQHQECWGFPESCVLCLCQDGSDLTDQLPVRCTLDYCGYDCPTYEDEKACPPNSESCGDWGVPCCQDPFQVCDYTNRDPMTGEGRCQDLSCTEDTFTISGLPDWHYYPGTRFSISGAYTRKVEHAGSEMGYAKYIREVDGGDGQIQSFALYPYLAGSTQLGWTLFCETCGFLWLVYSTDFNIDITATDSSSWVFQGNGGSTVCGEPAVGQCWHDSIDISGITIDCGNTEPFCGSTVCPACAQIPPEAGQAECDSCTVQCRAVGESCLASALCTTGYCADMEGTAQGEGTCRVLGGNSTHFA